ncbi:hypothetical protein [Cetobacterium somerae]
MNIKNYKKIIVTFFILLVTLLVGSEQKIPNIMILDNPQKEVSTVEGLKNKEVAEMNIKVKKMNVEEIEGYVVGNEFYFSIPKEKDKSLKKEKIVVIDSLNNQKLFQNTKIKMDTLFKSEIIELVETTDKHEVIKITNIKDGDYILKIDEQANQVNKVFKAKIQNKIIKNINHNFETITINKDITSSSDRAQSIQGITAAWWTTKMGYLDTVISTPSYYTPPIIPNSSANIYTAYASFATTVDAFRDAIQVPLKPNSYQANYKSFRNAHAVGWVDGFGPYNSVDGPLEKWEIGMIVVDLNKLPLGRIEVKGGIWRRFDSPQPEERVYTQAIYNITRNSRKGTVDMSAIQMEELKGEVINVPSDLSKFSGKISGLIADDFDYILRDSNENIKIELSALEDSNTKITDVSRGTQREVRVEKDGAVVRIGYFQRQDTIANFYFIVDNASKTRMEINLNVSCNDVTDELKLLFNPMDIGEVEFQIDKRLKSLNAAPWVKANGDLLNLLNGSSNFNMSEFIKLSGDFLNTDVTSIKDVHFIEGRPSKTKYISSKYILFATSGTDIIDEAGMPYDIPINMLKNNLIISRQNSNNPEMLNHKFLLEGTNSNLYTGNIKEVYLGEDSAKGVGRIDLTSLPFTYTGWNTTGGTGEISSTHGAPSKMNLRSGKLFNWKSAVNPGRGHIVTELRVRNKGREETVNTTNLNGTLEINAFPKNDIGINSGGFYIRKKTYDSTPETYEIEIYYKLVLLGRLDLTITNSRPPFEIIGDDVIDFGAIIQGKSQTLDSNIVIKNLSLDKIIDIKLEKDIKIFKKSDPNTLLPTMGDLSIQKIGEESHIKTHLTINPTENQPIGDYEGEIILYIYIE